MLSLRPLHLVLNQVTARWRRSETQQIACKEEGLPGHRAKRKVGGIGVGTDCRKIYGVFGVSFPCARGLNKGSRVDTEPPQIRAYIENQPEQFQSEEKSIGKLLRLGQGPGGGWRSKKGKGVVKGSGKVRKETGHGVSQDTPTHVHAETMNHNDMNLYLGTVTGLLAPHGHKSLGS